ncbi:MAG: hypothetical protein QOJ65_2544 [Fimbriimonadaceae bacterium]|jgi:hypothetical protein|nr:hypothetical protein [Fimbriimonadaceae bacterium]
MEGLIVRTWALGVIVLACGAFTMLAPPKRSAPLTELALCKIAPDSVGEYGFYEDPTNPGQSYKMGKVTYETLDPSGIVARIYSSGNKRFDVVLIASDSSKSFHDPRVCFTASGWNIAQEKHTMVPTETRGKVPMTIVKMKGANGEERSALYCYKGPSGFESVARNMRWDMLVGQLLHGRNDQGIFYRFIPMSDNVSEDELLKFSSNYLDQANRASKGFF